MEAAHLAFVRRARGAPAPRALWKPRSDPRRPLAPSEGSPDARGGLVAARTLRATDPGGRPTLEPEEAGLRAMVGAAAGEETGAAL
jgi:hypothetical protein